MLNNESYCIAIKPISFFLPSEEADPEAVQFLATAISHADVWTTPIPVERETGIIMDGNHRIRAARILGLRYLPCVLLSYQDPKVTVMNWWTAEPFSVDRIFRSILFKKEILPYKTTRHHFAPALPRTDIRLAMLRDNESAPENDVAISAGKHCYRRSPAVANGVNFK